jgi:hypothetical protein
MKPQTGGTYSRLRFSVARETPCGYLPALFRRLFTETVQISCTVSTQAKTCHLLVTKTAI